MCPSFDTPLGRLYQFRILPSFFQYANYFDHIIVSTEAQKEELERDLSTVKPVSVLPVGGLEGLQYADNRKPYKLDDCGPV